MCLRRLGASDQRLCQYGSHDRGARPTAGGSSPRAHL